MQTAHLPYLFWEVKDSKLGEIWHGMEKPGVGELR